MVVAFRPLIPPINEWPRRLPFGIRSIEIYSSKVECVTQEIETATFGRIGTFMYYTSSARSQITTFSRSRPGSNTFLAANSGGRLMKIHHAANPQTPPSFSRLSRLMQHTATTKTKAIISSTRLLKVLGYLGTGVFGYLVGLLAC